MVSAHMITKISLSKSLFKEILQFCSTLVILQILAKKPFQHMFNVRSSQKFVVKTICCLLSFFHLKLSNTNYQNTGTVTLTANDHAWMDNRLVLSNLEFVDFHFL